MAQSGSLHLAHYQGMFQWMRALLRYKNEGLLLKPADLKLQPLFHPGEAVVDVHHFTGQVREFLVDA